MKNGAEEWVSEWLNVKKEIITETNLQIWIRIENININVDQF